MAFRFHVRATGGYHAQRRCQDEGDVFDAGTNPGRIGTAVTSGLRQVARDEASGRVSPDNLTNALTQQGRMVSGVNLRDRFHFALGQAQEIHVLIAASSPSALPFFPNNSAPRHRMSRLFYLSQGNVVQKFLHYAHRALEPAGLNRFGVLNEMGRAFGEWGGAKASAQARIDFTITGL